MTGDAAAGHAADVGVAEVGRGPAADADGQGADHADAGAGGGHGGEDGYVALVAAAGRGWTVADDPVDWWWKTLKALGTRGFRPQLLAAALSRARRVSLACCSSASARRGRPAASSVLRPVPCVPNIRHRSRRGLRAEMAEVPVPAVRTPPH